MKKLLISFIIIASSTFSLKAQSVDYGVVSGMNFAKITKTNPEADINRRIGFMVGLYGNFKLSNSNFSIQPELIYTQKGVEGTVSGSDVIIKLDYIEVPVLLKYDFIPGGKVSPNIYVGPYVAINVNTKAETAEGEADLGSFVKNADGGFITGLGLDVGFFDIGVQYSFGLIELGKNLPVATGKNSVLSLVVTI
ncbi:MAG TPA: porin family protein [Bacteroidales bacterium]|nr:porin family protein [Bacteroidales bacterium]